MSDQLVQMAQAQYWRVITNHGQPVAHLWEAYVIILVLVQHQYVWLVLPPFGLYSLKPNEIISVR